MIERVHPEFNQQQLEELAATILQETKRQGADSAEVDIAINKGFNVTARKGDVESVEYHQDKIIDITVYVGKKLGAASISDIRQEAIEAAVKAACHIARYTDEDIAAGLAEKELLAFNYPKLELSYPWGVTVPEAIELTRLCESKALSMDKRIIHSEGVSLITSAGWHLYGNTHGFIGTFPITRHEISCVLIAKQKEEMQRDYSYTIATDPALLESIDFIANNAVERTLRRLGGRRLSTRQVPVIFAAEEARGLLGNFVAAISGGNLYRRSSFLLDHLGKQIFPHHVTLREFPHLEKALGSSPFDDDGVATRENIFIEQGILASYALGVYSARKLGLQTTANAGGLHNLIVTTGNKNLSELLKTMDTGLLVTELMGNGTNLVTGDYSHGASGFWVEKGEIQYPVEEITIAGNLKEMYARIIEIGNDIDHRGNIQTGSILIENMMVAGN